MRGFLLKVDKKGLVLLSDERKQKAQEVIDVTTTVTGTKVNFTNPNEDGTAFSRCLSELKEGDVIEIQFLPFLPKRK